MRLLKRKEAAKFLGISESTLAVWASTKRYGLAYVRVGGAVRYQEDVLKNFIEKNTHLGGGKAR